MDRRRVDTVKVVERFTALDLVDVNEIRETLGLVNELFLERRQKHFFVEFVGAAAHDFASGHQIHRRTDRDGRRQERCVLRAFAHVFGNVVTAEAHADRINRRRDETFVNRPQYPVAIVAVAGKVRPRQTIGQTAASSEMRNDASPTAFDTLVHQRFCVMAVRITLQSMEMHQHRRVELHRLRFRPIQHDEVSVGHIHNFSSILHVGSREKTGGNDGLKMRSGQPAGSLVVGLKQRHRANKRKKMDSTTRLAKLFFVVSRTEEKT